MNTNLLNDLLTGNTFNENLAILNKKFEELAPLIKAKGGLDTISSLEVEANSKAELARDLLSKARQEAESLLDKAKVDAAEAVKTATEKAGQLSILAEKSLTSAKEQEAENKKAKILLTQEKVRIETESKALKTLQSDLGKREAEIARKESILSQLKA